MNNVPIVCLICTDTLPLLPALPWIMRTRDVGWGRIEATKPSVTGLLYREKEKEAGTLAVPDGGKSAQAGDESEVERLGT